MQTSTTNVTASVLNSGPRAGAPRVTSRGRNRLLLALGAVLVIGGGAWMANRFGLLSSVLGGAGDSSSVYVVKPIDLSITLSETGELKPLKSVEVLCDVEGQSTIRTVVPESTTVKKGTLLVELASDELTDKLDQATLEARRAQMEHEAAVEDLAITRSKNSSAISAAEIAVKVKELELRQYKEGEFIKSLKSADIDIEQTLMDIRQKEEDLAKNKGLAEKGFVTQSKLDELEFALKKSRMELEKNQLAKQILERFDNPKNETQKQSDLKQAQDELQRVKDQAVSQEKQAVALVQERQSQVETNQKRLERAQKAVEKARIFAPSDGVVKYPGDEGGMRWGNENRIAPGQKVFEGQVLVVLPDTTKMVVSTRIHEADRHKIREGLTCLVRVPAVPDEVFTGKLGKIAQFADSAHRYFNPELKEHTAEVLLDNTNAPVSPGDSAHIEVLIETVPNALAVPVQCVFTRGSRSYVFVRQLRAAALREVKTGRASTTFVEITNGLAAGDAVYMHATEDMLAMLPAADEGNGNSEMAKATERAGHAKRKPEAAGAAGGGAAVSGKATEGKAGE